MKSIITLTILCLIGASSSYSIENEIAGRTLQQDFQDFIALIPQNKLMMLALNYLNSDPEIHAAIEYIQSPAFMKLYTKALMNKDLRNVVQYLEEAGIPVVDLVNKMAEYAGLPPYPKFMIRAKTGGFKGLLEEALALLPKDKLKAMYEEKLKTSPEFKALIEKLNSAEYKALVAKLDTSGDLMEVRKALKGYGLDLEKLADLVKSFFGLQKFE